MIIDHIKSNTYECNHVSFEDFENIVCAANIAGYLETREQVIINNDMELTQFILKEYGHWFNKKWMDVSFSDYITSRLIQEFGGI